MSWKISFFDYPLQFAVDQNKYMDIIRETLTRGAYILGEDLKAFESNLAEFTGSRYAVGVGNCTDALLLSLMALGVGPGDEVISVSHTFAATIEVINFLGATPVFVDVTDDHNMDINQVAAAITPKTKAIIPVHLNGRICSNMDKLVDLADEKNITIIEDAAQSLGGSYKGKGAGTFGLAGCFSFYPAKLLGTFGDAGAVITDDAEFAEKIKQLRNHGRGDSTDINIWGLNCRMDNLHAAILKYKLTLLPDWLKRRRDIATIYNTELTGIKEIKLPPAPVENSDHYDVFQNYEIEVEDRVGLTEYLAEYGIQAMRPWGGKGVHQMSLPGLDGIKLPRTEEVFDNSIMLPLYPELDNKTIKYVAETVQNFYKNQ